MEKILIIDDDIDLVDAMKLVLENKGYTVESAESGREGLDKLNIINPDLIILDVMMESGDSGFDAARTIRQNPNNKNIPILMLTAIKEKIGFDFSAEAGDTDWLPVDDYVEKPIQPDALLNKVEKLLKEKST